MELERQENILIIGHQVSCPALHMAIILRPCQGDRTMSVSVCRPSLPCEIDVAKLRLLP